MITRREILNDFISLSMQAACRDVVDSRIDLSTFHSALERELKDSMAAGYRYPAVAAYLMECGFLRIDQGREDLKDRLEDALSVVIKSARSKSLLGMMMDMPISGMHGMASGDIPLKEYASMTGFAPLKNVSVLKGDNPFVRVSSSREPSWQKALSEIFGKLVPALLDGTLPLQEFKRQATNTTGDMAYGYADALFMTMSKGFEYFAVRAAESDAGLAKKLGIFKAAVSVVISAADTDAKQRAVMDEMMRDGIPETIENAFNQSEFLEFSIEQGYEATRRPEMVREIFATPATLRLYGNDEGESVTPMEYARMMTRHSSAVVAQVARDVALTLRQHDTSRQKD